METVFQSVLLCVLALTIRAMPADSSDELDRTKELERCLQMALRRYKRCLHACPYRDVNGFNQGICKLRWKERRDLCQETFGAITDVADS